MKSNVEYNFCMGQFRPAIYGLAVLLVVVLGWTTWHYSEGQHRQKSTSYQRNPANLNHPVKPVAFQQYTGQSLGLSLQAVPAQSGQANQGGILVRDVALHSSAGQAGINPGDYLLRIGKVRPKTLGDVTALLNVHKPGNTIKITIQRGTRSRNMFLKLPLAAPSVSGTPMQQQGVKTIALQSAVPAPGIVGSPAVGSHYGKTAVTSTGPRINDPISPQFGTSPWFILFDPAGNSYSAAANPNANDLTGQGIQTAQYMVDLGVSHVVGDYFSQEALSTFHTLRVNVSRGFRGTVLDVINAGGIFPTGAGQGSVQAGMGNPGPAGQTIY